MAYNLLVTFDLANPGQNYDAVHERIKSLGKWLHPQQSVFYLHTALSAEQAHSAIWAVMDANDRLIVADVARMVITPSSADDIAAINQVWNEAA